MAEYRWIRAFLIFAILGIVWQLFYAYDYVRRFYERESDHRRILSDLNDTLRVMSTQPQFSRLDDDAYEFLYGHEFEKALARAEKAPKKTILFWHPDGDLSMTFTADLPRECGGCLVRDDKNLINDEKTEAVVILFDYTVHQHRPKVKRNPNQYWIWRCAEAPPYMQRGDWLNVVDEMQFNLTLTYRADSDIFLNYGSAVAETGTRLKDPLATKKRLALIAVSNCGLTPGAQVRMQFIRELQKRGLQLTAIGRCFRNNFIARMDIKKMQEYTSQHKFYFAFENSYHCKDYVTEKFFRALQAGVVPVVWGSRREVYETYIPSSGFIFLEDFPSAQSFIDYLHYLDGNDTAYLEYFRWRTERNHHPQYKRKTSICQICRFLHGINVDDAYKVPYKDLQKNQSFISDRPSRKLAPSIKKWWGEDDNADCYKKKFALDENGMIVFH